MNTTFSKSLDINSFFLIGRARLHFLHKDGYPGEYNETLASVSQAILEILEMIGKQLLDEALTRQSSLKIVHKGCVFFVNNL